MIEEWRDIEGHEGTYQVSNLGRVKSLRKICHHRTGTTYYKKEYMVPIRVGTSFNGYTGVALAVAFIENPLKKEMVNHINGIKIDNRINNLEWTTRSENIKHAFSIGLNAPKRGSDNFLSKLKEEDIIAIRIRYYLGESTYKIYKSDDFKTSYTNVKDIVARRTWAHI
jgi:ribosomal protein L31E